MPFPKKTFPVEVRAEFSTDDSPHWKISDTAEELENLSMRVKELERQTAKGQRAESRAQRRSQRRTLRRGKAAGEASPEDQQAAPEGAAPQDANPDASAPDNAPPSDRTATKQRATKETSVEVELNLDGSGRVSASTGLPFFDHMLAQLGRHGGFDLSVRAKGDLEIDAHHTVEDTGIVLGGCLAEALGDKVGVRRFASSSVPLDEALVDVSVDLSGRPFLHYEVEPPGEKILGEPPFGWPQDAVDAALVALHGHGHLKAIRNGVAVPAMRLDQTAIRAAEFRPETVVLTTKQRIDLRGLFQKANVIARPGDEASRAGPFVDALREMAEKAGGDPPLPAPSGLGLLNDLGRLAGNEQLAAILEEQDQLLEAMTEWRTLGERKEARVGVWDLARALCGHGASAGMAVANEVGAELDAVAERRSLLDEMDPAAPCAAKLAGALREALVRARTALAQAVIDAVERLERDDAWQRLDTAARATLLSRAGLIGPESLSVETDEAVRRALDVRDLAAWRAEAEAVPAREAAVLEEAAKQLEGDCKPVAVTVRRQTLRDEAAVRGWLVEHERKLMEAVRKGTVVVK